MQLAQAYPRIEALIYETVSGSRFTQRSPVMPEVWTAYGLKGQGPQDLLLIANWEDRGGMSLADALAARLGAGLSREAAEDTCADARLAPTQSGVVAELDFVTFMRAALPLSPWWHRHLLCETISADGGRVAHEPSPFFKSEKAFRPLRAVLRDELEKDLRPAREGAKPRAPRKPLKGGLGVTGDFVWFARVAGGMRLLHRDFFPDGVAGASEARLAEWDERRRDPDAVLDALFELLADVAPPGAARPLWSVHRNRKARISMRGSTSTVKADAARQLFGVAGRGIRWAVIDTGIDATHAAFQNRAQPVAGGAGRAARRGPAERSRILATYDFTSLRELMALQPRYLEALEALEARSRKQPGAKAAKAAKAAKPAKPAKLPEQAAARLPQHLRDRIERDPQYRAALLAALRRTRGQFRASEDGEAKLVPAGRTIDWEVWEPMLRVTHDREGYRPPGHEHGTHVAGILAADWRPEDRDDDPVAVDPGQPRRSVDRKGICPEIELYDFRALRDDGTADEFTILSALQYVRAINVRHEHVQIHGVNLSLSLFHEVANYACGQTPICEESERLVGNGVVVVAAAGNNGMARYVTTEGEFEDGYRTVSITDPGNAPSVITVGATHRSSPHTYGVSFFSSRGPTGDGRAKPDLVAPGEKVTSTVPNNGEKSLDGTSMAAPHVSGAAALLLCRHAELIGRPAEVKRILCQTATDLGRERTFQGAGLLDILRALESV
jgi:serine protease AprX